MNAKDKSLHKLVRAAFRILDDSEDNDDSIVIDCDIAGGDLRRMSQALDELRIDSLEDVDRLFGVKEEHTPECAKNRIYLLACDCKGTRDPNKCQCNDMRPEVYTKCGQICDGVPCPTLRKGSERLCPDCNPRVEK